MTAPVNKLFWVKVIALLPALKLAVPGIVKIPDCEIAPPAVKDNTPPLFKVTAGKLIGALVKFKVKLRKLLSALKFGALAPALILAKLMSLILPVPSVNTGGVVPKSLFRFNKISTLEASVLMVVVPLVAVIMPVCETVPPETRVKLRPKVEVGRIVAMVLVTLTSLAPLLFKEIEPVNALLCVNVIGLAPAVKLEVPGIINAAV